MNFALMSYRIKNQLMSFIAPSRTAKKTLAMFMRPRRSEPKAWELKAENRGERFNLNENISAICWQEGDVADPASSQGKNLLLIHGWESRATQMYGLVPRLLELGYRVTALDMPAHGKSQGDMANAELFVQTLLLAQEKLGKFDAVIGHSMGAGAASLALSRGLETDKLVLVSGPSSIENVLRRFSKIVGLNRRATGKFIDFASELVGVHPSELDASKQNVANPTPTLIVHDLDDREVPISESRRLLPSFENAEFFETRGLGHRKILKSPQLNDKIYQFLAMATKGATA
ncbi:alpha/beta hydrolase [Thalassomonas actiniarum]|uniref:Alpha/beta hydrolase n=1 Tax=Thalassomonas actiniarum TaxID=485447 RepID=A0AAE9YLW1_9GAMM|nr:alpha/beta hydrolase [Thalassomonas actiniarum]WDD97774.1 alpha/beta hydrolase [Thalassomonas actiniarum]